MEKHRFQETCPACGQYDEQDGGKWDMINEHCWACEYDEIADNETSHNCTEKDDG